MNSNNQQQQAKDLYFQTDLTKTQIAEQLNIPRRTLHYWIRQKNWDRLKKAANHMPSLLAENCYHIIARFSEHLLSESRIMRPITHQEADTLHKLALTVTKLKNHSTLNENMETFGCFMEAVNQKSPKLAKEIMPIVDDFISDRGNINVYQFKPDNMNDMGLIPMPEMNNEEIKLDIGDIMAWDAENEAGNETQYRQQPTPQPQTTTDTNPQPTSSPEQAPTAAQYTGPVQQPANTGNTADLQQQKDDLNEDVAYELKMLEEVLKNRPQKKVPLTEEEFKAYWQHEQPSSTNELTTLTHAAVAA